jgi:hypothetical protein
MHLNDEELTVILRYAMLRLDEINSRLSAVERQLLGVHAGQAKDHEAVVAEWFEEPLRVEDQPDQWGSNN